jgi:protein-tyrosine sulfotransferase
MTTSESIAGAPSAAQGIIVLGVPRTGTTLLRRLLNGHRDICCPGETFLLASAARFLRADRVADGIDYGVLGGLAAAGIAREQALADLRGLVESLFGRIAARAGKPRWASKTAIDAFYLGEIEQLMAGHARFVCIVRHGLDAALSLKDLCDANEVYIREIHDYIVRNPRPLVAFAQLWADLTAALLGFAQRRGAEAIVLRYEDLVAQPAAVLDRVAAFLGLEPGSLRTEVLDRDSPSGLGDWKTYGKAGIDGASVGRWRSLGPASLQLLAPVVNPVLGRAGYDTIATGLAPDADLAMRRYEITMGMKAKRSRAGKPDRD